MCIVFHFIRESATMRKHSHERRGRTVVETAVVIVILGMLLSIIMPVIGMARENALGTTCQTHLRILGQAIEFYMTDYNFENWLPASEMPDGPRWFEKLEPFVSGHETGRQRENFVCTRAPYDQRGFTPSTISFGWNEGFLPFGTLSNQVLAHGETIVIADSQRGPEADVVLSRDAQDVRFDPRHLGNGNVLFLAGHVGALCVDEIVEEWPRYWDRE